METSNLKAHPLRNRCPKWMPNLPLDLDWNPMHLGSSWPPEHMWFHPLHNGTPLTTTVIYHHEAVNSYTAVTLKKLMVTRVVKAG